MKTISKLMLGKVADCYSFQIEGGNIPAELLWTSPDLQIAIDLAEMVGYGEGSYELSEEVSKELKARNAALFEKV